MTQLNRYVRRDGTEVNISNDIYEAVRDDVISYKEKDSTSGERLDLLAYEYYKDATLWWVIAAASGIGWWMQMPEGIKLKIPLSIEEIKKVVGQ